MLIIIRHKRISTSVNRLTLYLISKIMKLGISFILTLRIQHHNWSVWFLISNQIQIAAFLLIQHFSPFRLLLVSLVQHISLVLCIFGIVWIILYDIRFYCFWQTISQLITNINIFWMYQLWTIRMFSTSLIFELTDLIFFFFFIIISL